MRKWIIASVAAAVLCGQAAAAEPTTLTDKADKLDEVIFGNIQTGSFIDRVGDMDEAVYGSRNAADGLDRRVSDLYRDVIRGGEEENTPSLSTRVNTLEYYLTDEIKQDALGSRIEVLESAVFGAAKTGPLSARVAELEKAIYGDTHFELAPVVLPANTVFKISLNEEVGSKINEVGNPVHFTVQEDVLVDDVIVLPRGAQGSGVITKVSRPKMFGRSGSLEISFNQVFSIDDEEIPTVLGPESRDKLKMEAAAVGASAVGALALGPIGLVGGLFVKGKDVDMPAGTELYIQTQQDVNTRGMKQTPGAPKLVVGPSGKTEDVAVTITDHVEKTAAAPEEPPLLDNGGDEPAAGEEEQSVVVVRHE